MSEFSHSDNAVLSRRLSETGTFRAIFLPNCGRCGQLAGPCRLPVHTAMQPYVLGVGTQGLRPDKVSPSRITPSTWARSRTQKSSTAAWNWGW